MKHVTRRTVLRGVLNGGVVTVSLPLLNCFLNENGTAYASGEAIPVRFASWFWALGMNQEIFYPKKFGTIAPEDLPHETASLKSVSHLLNIFSGFNVYRDSQGNICHHTGWITQRSGICPSSLKDFPGETIDVTVANKVGGFSRFRSLTCSATGNGADTVSYEGQNSPNTADAIPSEFYQKLFGPDFQDPNAAEFVPNPRIMAQNSVLSAVLEKSNSLSKKLGTEDRARLDQYFTALREMEHQLANQLNKPEPIAACVRPNGSIEEVKAGTDVELVQKRHRMMTDLLVMAVTCNQTRVINMSYAHPIAGTSRTGYSKTHHSASHEEPIDVALGYQPTVSYFAARAIEEFSYFVNAFHSIKEGEGTLLDHTLVFAHSDQSLAKIHGITNLPMFTAGRAGGKLKTGLHIAGHDTPCTRLGYTILRTLGVEVSNWGSLSNRTDKEITEILV